jgi:MFS family permease
VIGLLLASTIVGAIISRTGTWKRWMVIGASLLTVGVGLMSTIRFDTPFPLLFLYMGIMGLGIGMLMQNMVLVVQNTVDVTQIGAASAAVAFFRSLGGAVGVAALGAALAARVKDSIISGLEDLGIPADQAGAAGSGTIPQLADLPAPVRTVIETAYGQGIGEIFLIALPLAVLTVVMVALLPNIPLGRKTGVQQLAEKEAETLVAVGLDEIGATPRS